MKATQAKQEPEVRFEVPPERKGGKCHHCNKTIKDYWGTHIGHLVFCNMRCVRVYAFGGE